jgi:hypothetical protein
MEEPGKWIGEVVAHLTYEAKVWIELLLIKMKEELHAPLFLRFIAPVSFMIFKERHAFGASLRHCE